MTTEQTIISIMGIGITSVAGALGLLWRKLEKYQVYIETKLSNTEQQLVACEESRLAILTQSIERETELETRIKTLEAKA